MTSTADTYNYPAFSFALEDGAYEHFLREAPQLGESTPPFELPDLEDRYHRLTDYRGHPVVVEFGSCTCPIFCGHNPAMERLARAHPEAVFVTIYTREAHPGERIGAHRSMADKTAAARRLRDEDGFERLVLIDDLDGTTHRAYGATWDAVFVLDGDGRVVLRRAWNDPTQVGSALEDLRLRSARPCESIEMSPPASGGGFGHGLLRGGRQALIDFYRSAPPPVRQLLEASESAEVRAVIGTADVAGRPAERS